MEPQRLGAVTTQSLLQQEYTVSAQYMLVIIVTA